MAAADELIERITQRLLPAPEPTDKPDSYTPDWMPEGGFDRPPRDAAVLIALVRRGEELSVLYTERSPELRSHSGQIAFPGGKLDAGDSGPGAAALREAWEEVALDPADARILGYMPAYFTGTNYLITPVVAVVTPHRQFVGNPGEVKSVFEVPLPMLMREESFGTFHIRRKNLEGTSWQIEHEGLVIWGITANLTRRFYELVLKDEIPW
ncbi:MAG: CoA pyrophosphatase [Devosia nanyangense]|uniref:CoA pyrophosphatase n=1 Tax=Devosia nanyangense TaxID=1228055 RepID=A0A933L138_9HYPH|nr:CoA pyrophosphatase [Devosia nanyangense]